jgi:hypothetical protein
MGKRSKFPRRDRDFYPTPFEAVPPLVPYLQLHGIRTFAEPCCGDGALVRHLESFGFRCVYQGDIADGRDALAVTDFGAADAIITNTPYKRRIMRALLTHFTRSGLPTWLFLQTNWASNAWAAPFLPSCSDIVPVPRLRLIEGTEDSGQENHGWFRFDARHTAEPIFHARDSVPSRRCAQARCRRPLPPGRSDARYCSVACKQHAYRSRSRRLAVTET